MFPLASQYNPPSCGNQHYPCRCPEENSPLTVGKRRRWPQDSTAPSLVLEGKHTDTIPVVGRADQGSWPTQHYWNQVSPLPNQHLSGTRIVHVFPVPTQLSQRLAMHVSSYVYGRECVASRKNPNAGTGDYVWLRTRKIKVWPCQMRPEYPKASSCTS